MSRLFLPMDDRTKAAANDLLNDIKRRLASSQTFACPVEQTLAFLKLCQAQTCGKCVPCRVGLAQLVKLLEEVLDGDAEGDTLDLIEKTAETVFFSADCALGYETGAAVLRALESFRQDFESHVRRGRCLQGFEPVPCVAKCPAHVDIPGYVALVQAGRYEDAVRLIRKDNPLPGVCGLVCEHPCELACRRAVLDESVNICGLKRFAVSMAGQVPMPKAGADTGKRVAIVGGGPAGLTAAYFLRLMGHGVTIFEQRKQLGGMLRYGIPAYRLPRDLLQGEIDRIIGLGVEVITEVSVGVQPSVSDLKQEYDGVYIAIGAHTKKMMGIAGEDAGGVISAVELLRDIGDGRLPDFGGKRVCVIGGGNVAMDVARSAVRLGAASVQVVYRRRKIDIIAQAEEVEGVIAEGCEIVELAAPARLEQGENGCVAALWVQPQLAGPVEGGRPKPVRADLPEVRLACDLVLVAVGQDIQSQPFADWGLPTKGGRLLAKEDLSFENISGVFSGGDCVTGPATVIRAIAAGKAAAANIDEYLGYRHEISCDVDLPVPCFEDKPYDGRCNSAVTSAGEGKKSFALMEQELSCEQAHKEASRCLRCDRFGYGMFRGGRQAKW